MPRSPHCGETGDFDVSLFPLPWGPLLLLAAPPGTTTVPAVPLPCVKLPLIFRGEGLMRGNPEDFLESLTVVHDAPPFGRRPASPCPSKDRRRKQVTFCI